MRKRSQTHAERAGVARIRASLSVIMYSSLLQLQMTACSGPRIFLGSMLSTEMPICFRLEHTQNLKKVLEAFRRHLLAPALRSSLVLTPEVSLDTSPNTQNKPFGAIKALTGHDSAAQYIHRLTPRISRLQFHALNLHRSPTIIQHVHLRPYAS
jgi:hypothetical protein